MNIECQILNKHVKEINEINEYAIYEWNEGLEQEVEKRKDDLVKTLKNIFTNNDIVNVKK